MSEPILVNQINLLVDNTVHKVLGISKHLTMIVYVSIALLVTSLLFASTLYLAIPILVLSMFPLFMISRLAHKLLCVQKLDSGREEFIRFVNNQDSVKEKLQNSFEDAKSSIGKGKTNIKMSELIERAKLFLDIKHIIKAKNLTTESSSEVFGAVTSIALLGNPLYVLFIGFCYLWLIVICIGSVFTIIF